MSDRPLCKCHGEAMSKKGGGFQCAVKHRERGRRYYEVNPEKQRERVRRYREANREKERERKRRYYEANREKERERKRRYYEANREKEREYNRRWQQRKLLERAKTDPAIQRMLDPQIRKLEALIRNPGATEGEREAAFAALQRKGALSERKERWLRRQTTSAGTQSTPPGTTSRPALASSRGG